MNEFVMPAWFAGDVEFPDRPYVSGGDATWRMGPPV